MTSFPRFNRALTQAPASGIRRIVNAAEARRAKGLPVYAFHLGEPSFDTPLAVRTAAARALMEGHTHYAPNAGIPELRRAIAADLNRRHGSTLGPESVVVTVGACEALTLALMATLEPGDQVVIATPCWPNYLQLPKLLGAEVVEVPARPEQGFRPDMADLERAITPRTRCIILNSPNNPTGAMLRREQLAAALELARTRGVWLISDEIYQDITFGEKHVSVLELIEPGDPVTLVGGFSKSYAMTGWRLGYLIADPDYVSQFVKLHQYLVTSATSFAQWGALEAFSATDDTVAMGQIYQQHRAQVIKTLQCCRIDFVAPEGAFYVFAKVPQPGESSNDFCERMLMDNGLGFVPGSVFGQDFDNWFRVCFAGPTEELEAGLKVLLQAMTTRTE